MDNKESQNDELLALQSIYGEDCFVVEHTNPPCGRFSAHVQLIESFHIKRKCNGFNNIESPSNSPEADYERFEVSYLPPINLYFEYPESYPSDSPPAYLLSCNWLTYDELGKLCKQFDILWKENNGEVILFQWIQFLKEETLKFLGMEQCLDITEISKYNLKNDIVTLRLPAFSQAFNKKCKVSDKNCQNTEGASISESQKNSVTSQIFPRPSISRGNGFRDCRAFLDIAEGKVLRSLLRDYDQCKKTEKFRASYHLCDICYTDKLGSDFVTFTVCQHFFCRDCVKSYFELMINDGNVNSLNCLFDQCSAQADGTMVKQVVNKDCFERYDSLLLSRTLDTMSDIAYCPRKFCQCALVIDVSGRLGTCPACGYVFCPFCKMAYHGVSPCKFDPALKKQICQDYLTGNKFKKSELENRHGKRTIQTVVEEVQSEQWLGSNCKHCPRCHASIEKNEGCNKMTCFKCGTYFCWLCGAQLNSANPYRHYSDKSLSCFERLFPPEYFEQEMMFEPGEFLNF